MMGWVAGSAAMLAPVSGGLAGEQAVAEEQAGALQGVALGKPGLMGYEHGLNKRGIVDENDAATGDAEGGDRPVSASDTG